MMEEKRQQVMDSLLQGVIVMEENHRVIFLNEPIKRMMPFRQGPNAGELVWEILGDPDIAQIAKETLKSESKLVQHEVTLGIRGNRKTLLLDIIPLVEDKRVAGSLLTCTDVTEKRLQDVRLKRAESLASLTHMVAGVAHEIKNPLGAMAIYVQLMKREIEKHGALKEDPGVSYIEVLEDEIERLNKTVVDFLFAVRPIALEMELMDPSSVIDEVLLFLHPELEKQSIRVRKKYGKGLPLIELDARLFKQVLLNLFQNAISAMAGGGEITITTSEKEGFLHIAIKDTGCGIDPEIIHKIFDPYYTTRDTGTGLGLTLVYKIIQEHGGHIEATSSPMGTIMDCSFPIPHGELKLISNPHQIHPDGLDNNQMESEVMARAKDVTNQGETSQNSAKARTLKVRLHSTETQSAQPLEEERGNE